MEFSFEIYGLLFAVSLFAGFIDSISGGGGLIIIPTLVLLGLPPAESIATNKLQGVFGKLSAVRYYRQQGMLTPSLLKLPLLTAFIGAALGAILIQQVPADIMTNYIPWLIGIVAVYFALSPRVSDVDSKQRIHVVLFALFVTSTIGFYDGFFGPASGALFALGFVSLLGYNLSKATAYTRLMLLFTNIASLGIFVLGGKAVLGSRSLYGCRSMDRGKIWFRSGHEKGKQVN